MIIDEILQTAPRYIALRRDIHAHPEMAFKENRTSDVIAGALSAMGIEVHRGLAGTGVVGTLRAGTGSRSIALRADMDALPLQERNDFTHRSRHDGCMHACGHDGHTAMLLAAADYLSGHGNFDGTVYFIFQPAEESEGGARVMIEQGLFDLFPADAVFGLHNWPGLPVGQFGIFQGPVMASADRFDITITGHGAHAGMPHQGTDCLLAGSALTQALQSVVSRTLDPLDSAVLSITRFHAGEAYNITPDNATLGGTVRAHRAEVQDQIEAAMRQICHGIATSFGVHVNLDFRRGYPATVNSPAETQQCLQTAREVVGLDCVIKDLRPSMGAEDFSFMLQQKPGCYVWLGNGLGEGGCMLHNPHYDFNDEVLSVGASYWARLVDRVLAPGY